VLAIVAARRRAKGDDTQLKHDGDADNAGQPLATLEGTTPPRAGPTCATDSPVTVADIIRKRAKTRGERQKVLLPGGLRSVKGPLDAGFPGNAASEVAPLRRRFPPDAYFLESLATVEWSFA
jgi:hypothetical protein